jgi:F0F1-type ATP synthase assembly protein I
MSKLQARVYKVLNCSEERQVTVRRAGLTFFRLSYRLVKYFYSGCVGLFVAFSLVFIVYGLPSQALLALYNALCYGLMGHLLQGFCLGMCTILRQAEIAHKIK